MGVTWCPPSDSGKTRCTISYWAPRALGFDGFRSEEVKFQFLATSQRQVSIRLLVLLGMHGEGAHIYAASVLRTRSLPGKVGWICIQYGQRYGMSNIWHMLQFWHDATPTSDNSGCWDTNPSWKTVKTNTWSGISKQTNFKEEDNNLILIAIHFYIKLISWVKLAERKLEETLSNSGNGLPWEICHCLEETVRRLQSYLRQPQLETGYHLTVHRYLQNLNYLSILMSQEPNFYPFWPGLQWP